MASRTDFDEAKRDGFADRLIGSALGAFDLYTIYLGNRLGLYEALKERSARPKELADRAGINERYAREWLEQQAVTGILQVDDVEAEEDDRSYSMAPEHAEVLLDQDSEYHLAFLAKMAIGAARPIDELVAAYRSGAGVAWEAYGDDMREAQAEQNRPVFASRLGQEWLPALSEVHDRLSSDPPAHVADFACGAGYSTIAIAKAYPKAQVVGIDLDEPSLAMGRHAAQEAGVADRVTFEATDVADPALSGRYDLVTIFEALHDLSRPVQTLRAIKALLAPGGSVLVMDENVADSFTAPGNETERIFYHFSVLLCLPNGLVEQPSAATGTVMRTETLKRYAAEAGFSGAAVAPIKHDFFRFYVLTP